MSTTESFPSDQRNNHPWLDMTHYPTAFDIVYLKRFLAHSLPNELIGIILDLSEYWPHYSCSSTSSVKAQGKVQENLVQPHWLEHRGRETTTPLSFTDSSEDGFVLRSPPLAVPLADVVQSQALVPQTRHPVRMIVFEIRYYRLFAMNPKCRRRQVVRQSKTRLEVGIKKPVPSTESRLRAVREPDTRPAARVVQDSPQLQQVCDRIYDSWQLRRSFCDPAHMRIDLYMDHKALADGMVGQKTVIWRCDDDDDVAGANVLGDAWDLRGEPLPRLSGAAKAHVDDLVHSLANEDRTEQADFVKQLEVGDSLGVWVRVRDGPAVSMIERVSMHAFWAAS